jgi:hypothetical protein
MIEFGQFLDQAKQSKVRVKGASCFEIRIRDCRYGFGSVVTDSGVSLWIRKCRYGFGSVVTDSGVSLWIRKCRYGFGSVVLTVDEFDEARDMHETQEFDH